MSENFIGVFEAEDKIVDDINNFWSYHKKYATPGKTYNNEKEVLNNDVKQSLDLAISADNLYFPFDNYRVHLQNCLEQYIKLYSHVNGYSKFDIVENYNIQWYPKSGGFKEWHFESASNVDMSRVLVFMTFLNDVPDGGTMFKYQDMTIPAKKGLTVIWPTGFTHTHKGQISHTSEKLIVTGWWSLKNE
tara:strand:- start:73 stop:639 length:567 start_codon:yes stop_codon:yes gene_type:complete